MLYNSSALTSQIGEVSVRINLLYINGVPNASHPCSHRGDYVLMFHGGGRENPNVFGPNFSTWSLTILLHGRRREKRPNEFKAVPSNDITMRMYRVREMTRRDLIVTTVYKLYNAAKKMTNSQAMIFLYNVQTVWKNTLTTWQLLYNYFPLKTHILQ